MLSCASPVTPAPGGRWTEGRAVAWPHETAQVEPHGGDGLGETPEGIWSQPDARRHDTWAVARTQHGSVRTALIPSVWRVLSRPKLAQHLQCAALATAAYDDGSDSRRDQHHERSQ